MPSLGEVFIKLGFDVDDAKLKSFQDKVDDVGKEFLVLSGSAAGALYGLDRFLRGSVDNAVALQNLKDVTGETTAEIQKWQFAGHLMNTAESIDQIASSIHAVNRAMGEGTLGGNNDVFALLGISPFGKNGKPKLGTEFLDELSANFDKVKQRYSQFGGLDKLLPDLQKLGVSEGLYQALQLSSAQREAMTQNLILSDAQLQKNKEIAQSMEDFYTKLGQYKSALISDFAPGIEKAFDSIMPHIEKVTAGLSALEEFTGGWAHRIAAILFIAFAPLGAAAGAAYAIVSALEQIAEIKRVGAGNYFTEVKEGVENSIFDFNRWMNGVKQGPMQNGMTMDEFMAKSFYEGQGTRDGNGNWVPPASAGGAATVNQTNNFTVHGSGDPASTASHIGNEINRQNKAAFGQIDMGVRQ